MCAPLTFEQGIQVFTVLIEAAKAVLTWPVAFVVLGLVFLKRFKVPIDELIRRMESFRWGDKEVRAPRQADLNVTANEATKPIQLEPAPGQMTLPAAPADADARVANERERAALWEYRFLNRFLVPRTQFVLEWLANRNGPTSYGTYDAWWVAMIYDAAERSAIISALENHHLVSVDRAQGNLISVTEKGREYIGWRGPLDTFLQTHWPPAPRSNPPDPPPTAEAAT